MTDDPAVEQPDGPAPEVSDKGKGDDAPEVPPGVMIVKQKDEQGNIAVDAVPVGGVELTEVLTLLEMAQSAFRQKVGLPGR